MNPISVRKQNISVYSLANFGLETLVCNSKILKGNPLGDPSRRYNPVMVPVGEAPPDGFPVVLILSGFTGNGTYSVSLPKEFKENQLQQIDRLVTQKRAPRAIYVFVDAITRLGGSQFLDSPFTGNYESYLVKELVPSLRQEFLVKKSPKSWCVAGGSSGGYGALNLISKYPNIFGYAIALAPDCDFENCYHQDLLRAAQFIRAENGYRKAVKRLLSGSLTMDDKSHQIWNGLAMAACYSAANRNDVNFPLSLETGEWEGNIRKIWLSKDPLNFVIKRKKNILKANGIFLGCGDKDEFFLNFGVKKLSVIMKKIGASIHVESFSGGHFDLQELRSNAYSWLRRKWS